MNSPMFGQCSHAIQNYYMVCLYCTVWQQHDVQELCRVMFDALEVTWRSTDQENLINQLYQGKMKDYVECLEVITASMGWYSFNNMCINPMIFQTKSNKTHKNIWIPN